MLSPEAQETVDRVADAINAIARELYGEGTVFALGTDANVIAVAALRAAGVKV
jgi:hypothetical protein